MKKKRNLVVFNMQFIDKETRLFDYYCVISNHNKSIKIKI